jgi:hypothetical protein
MSLPIDWNQIEGAATAATFVIGAIVRLWKLIKKRFDSVEMARTAQIFAFHEQNKNMLAAIQQKNEEWQSSHEIKDSERHTDNVGKFDGVQKELIYIGKALVVLGWRNGSGHVEPRAD